MKFRAYVDFELEEGRNMSKDLLSEEFIVLYEQSTIGIVLPEEAAENDQDQFEILAIHYVGSKKGKPLEFEVLLEGESPYDYLVAEEIEEEWGSEYVDVEDSQYSVSSVEVKEYDDRS